MRKIARAGAHLGLPVACSVVFSAIVLFMPTLLHAQQDPSHPTHPSSATPAGTAAGPSAAPAGSIIGIVADSLHGAPLVQASVTVVQLPRKSAMTAPSGAFRIDSLPQGTYTLEVLHPLLDSLGIRLVSDSLVIAPAGVRTVVLSVPPATQLVQTLCTPLERKLGPAAVIGHVLDADTDTPEQGVEVSAAWIETDVSMQRGVHSAPRLRKTTTAVDGSFRLCGLPQPFNGTLQAALGQAQTAEVRLDAADVTQEGPLTLRTLRLPSLRAIDTAPPPPSPGGQSPSGRAQGRSGQDRYARGRASRLRTGNGVVTGRVTNHAGAPLADAIVTVQGGASHAVSGTDGTFTLSGVPTGTQVVLIRHIGYTPAEFPVDVTSHGAPRITADLGEYIPRLASVKVEARPSLTGLEHTGFLQRKKTGMGRYVTAEDIEEMQPVYTSDVLRHIVGLHVFGEGHTLSVTSRGNACVRYMVDRNAIDPRDNVSVDELVNPADIAALEFYQPSEIPAALTTGRDGGCALLVIWTRSQVKPAR